MSTHEHPTYQILDKIGEGPWTLVYKAWDNSPLQREVAVKMLRDECRKTPHLREQFWERIKAMSDLRHERLLPVYNTDADRDWIVVELADDNMENQIAKGKVSLQNAQSFLAQMLEALDVLHGYRRLHGQIKPSNLLYYEKSGRMKLTDPGVLIDGDLQLMPGTEKYLAPELADPKWGDGQPPGPQLDLYTLGFCVLEMLAGPEFDSYFPGMSAGGADKANLWWQWHASDADPRVLIDKLVPKSAKQFKSALDLMLRKKVSERAGSAEEVLQILGTSVIPEEIRQDARVTNKAPKTDGEVSPLDRSPVVTGITTGGSKTPGTKRTSAPPIASKPASASPQPKKPFLEDTRKVAITAGLILFLGIVSFVVVDLLKTPPKDLRQIEIASSPVGATVLVNGEDVGVTPYKGEFDSAEKYEIAVSLKGHKSPEPRELKAGEPVPESGKIVFEMTPVPPEVPKKSDPIVPTAPELRTVVVTSDPPNASINVDGKSQSQKTPAKLSLAPGPHTLIVSLADFVSKTEKVTVPAGRSDFTVPNIILAPTHVPLRVASQPSGAKVVIDGKEQTKKTPGEFSLLPGKHKVEVSLDGYKPLSSDVVVVDKGIDLDLFKLETIPPEMRTVMVKSDPPKAAIKVNGKLQESKTPAKLSLLPGDYSVDVSLPYYKSAKVDVKVPKGATPFEVPTLKLTAIPLAVRIVSLPPGAEISIDGKPSGKTDNTLELAPGNYNLEVTLKDFPPQSREVTIEPGDKEIELDPFEFKSPPLERISVQNSIGMTLVKIDAGKFHMGDEGAGEPAADVQEPNQNESQDKDAEEKNSDLEEVEIDHDFFISDAEVTVEQFKQFMSERTDYKTDAEKDNKAFGFDSASKRFVNDPKYSWKNTGWDQTPQDPVVNVSWLDAQEFCRWLSEKEKQTYRLPTEAEWEYVCKAGTKTRFSFGNDPADLAKFDNIADQSLQGVIPKKETEAFDDGVAFTAPIRKYGPGSANPWGVYNMHGNVREWCQINTEIVPAGELAHGNRKQAVRGGSWYYESKSAGPTSRSSFAADMVFNYVGFRVVGDLKADPPFKGESLEAPAAPVPAAANEGDPNGPGPAPTSVPDPDPLNQALNTKIDIDFRREPLQDAFNFIAKAAKVEIRIDGDALKSAGYTKNMPQTIKATDIQAREALGKIVAKYDNMCLAVDEENLLIIVTVLKKAKADKLKVIEFK